MPKEMHASPLSYSYARALLDLANEQGQAEVIGQELRELKHVMDETPVFADFLRDPAISQKERADVLGKVFQGRVSPLVWNFLRVLHSKGRLALLPALDTAYAALLDKQLGKVEADVTVSQWLNDDQLADVGRRVGEALGKQAIVRQIVDESIIGGLVVRVGDRVIDASVRQQLRSMRQRLLAARPA